MQAGFVVTMRTGHRASHLSCPIGFSRENRAKNSSMDFNLTSSTRAFLMGSPLSCSHLEEGYYAIDY